MKRIRDRVGKAFGLTIALIAYIGFLAFNIAIAGFITAFVLGLFGIDVTVAQSCGIAVVFCLIFGPRR